MALSKTPTYDRIMATCPHAQLITSGPDVGLPTGQMGNSEVGHTNIGAGRVVAMDLGQIDLAIEDGSFQANPRLLAFADKVKAAGGRAHLMGRRSRTAACTGTGSIVLAATERRRCAGARGGDPRADRRPRRGAGFGQGFVARAGRGAAGGRRHRHGDRPLLCDGPRQPLGAGRAGLCGDDRRQGRGGPRRPPARRWRRPMRAARPTSSSRRR